MTRKTYTTVALQYPASLVRQLVWMCLALYMLAPMQLLAATTAQLDSARVQAIAWLLSNQQGDGSWRSGEGSEVQTTATALTALTNAGVTGPSYARGLAWLANAEAYSVDALARQIQMMAAVSLDTTAKIAELLSQRNQQSAWGTYDRYSTSFPDTPLASSAIRTDNATYLVERGRLLNAMCQIVLAQKSDGSWSYAAAIDAALLPSDSGAILPTVYNVLELASFVNLGVTTRTCSGTSYNFPAVVNVGLSWLVSQRLRVDGGFSELATQGGVGTVLETALVYNTLNALAPSDPRLIGAQDFLINNQDADGAWQGDALATAMAATTLPPATLSDTDQDGVPDQVESVLGTNPLVFDSRSLATGNGQSVEGVNEAYGFTANLSQSSTINLPTLVGAVSSGPTPPVNSTADFGTIAAGASLTQAVGVYVNVSSSTQRVSAKLINNVSGAFNMSGEQFLSGLDVLPGETLAVTVSFDSAGQTNGTKTAFLEAGGLVPPGAQGPELVFGVVALSGNVEFSTGAGISVDTGGTSYSSWTISQGRLPDGMSINTSTGIVAGTPVSSGTYSFVVSAINSVTGQTDEFALRVVVNSPPQLVSPGVQTNKEGDAVVLDIQSSDLDGDILTYSVSGLPPGLSLFIATGRISGTLDFVSSGIYTTTVTATDGKGVSSQTFTWNVNDVPRAPIMSDPGNLRNQEGDSVSVALNGFDPDGNPVTYAVSGLPPGLSLSPAGVISGTIGFNAQVTYNVSITASDGSASSTLNFTWVVTEINRAPSLQPLGVQMLNEGESLVVPLVASDPDGDVLSFVTSSLPAFISLFDNGDGTGTLAISPGATQAGIYNLGVIATDNAPTPLNASQNLIVVVNDVTAPTDVVRMQSSQGAFEVELYGNVAPNTVANFLSYVNGGSYNTSFIHDVTQPGSIPFGFRSSVPGGVIQGGLYRYTSDTNSYSFVPQDLPVAGEASLSNTLGTLVMLPNTAGDPNSASSIWYINLGNNSPTLDSQNNTVFGRVIRGWNALNSIISQRRWNTATLNIFPLPPTRLPFINYPGTGAISPYLVMLNPVGKNALTAKDASLDLNGDGVGDRSLIAVTGAPFRMPLPIPVGGVAPYSYQIVSGVLPGGISLDPITGLITGIPSVSGNYSVAYRATDSVGQTADGAFLIVANAPPTIAKPVSQIHEEGQLVSLQVVGGGAEAGETLTYSATNLPPGLSIDAVTGLISGTISAATAGTYNAVVSVSDGSYITSTGFIWTVDLASGLIS